MKCDRIWSHEAVVALWRDLAEQHGFEVSYKIRNAMTGAGAISVRHLRTNANTEISYKIGQDGVSLDRMIGLARHTITTADPSTW